MSRKAKKEVPSNKHTCVRVLPRPKTYLQQRIRSIQLRLYAFRFGY